MSPCDEGLKDFHGLKAGGAVELFARSATSGVPSESRLFLVALRGVMPAYAARLSNGYAYVCLVAYPRRPLLHQSVRPPNAGAAGYTFRSSSMQENEKARLAVRAASRAII